MADDDSLASYESRPQTSKEIREAFLEFFSARGHAVIPSASLIPKDPTVLLTIAGMLPFKPVFLGQEQVKAQRVTSIQKCIRTNDIENVGRTARHQTFFEMLGNFSFGNYFKRDAIHWAWELSTQIFKLAPENLVISVFKEDGEAEKIWRDEIGVDPKRIIRMGEKDNFWSSGQTGPCGPCSEMYYDFTPEAGDELIDLEDEKRFIEFYNLVFMEFNRDSHGKLTSLKSRNIDTGMGLERMAQILQKVPNNYETDLIFPLLEKAAQLANIDYQKVDDSKKMSLKIIGDHSRAITHLICDGVTASNLGRGYVLRRLLRRVVRHGQLIGISQPFLGEMGDTVIKLMGSIYPNLIERRGFILKELQREENSFMQTLERGEQLLSELLKTASQNIKGEDAFELYDTYGFPLELTQEIASEHNLTVDINQFAACMQKQRERAKAATVNIDLTIRDIIDEITTKVEPTVFIGYESLDDDSIVRRIIVNGSESTEGNPGDNLQIILNQTPFYGESGGQVGDQGYLVKASKSEGVDLKIKIKNVDKKKDVYIHHGQIEKGRLCIGDVVHSEVDGDFRRRTQIHHTATHLLQAALKKVLGPEISQAGSLVDFDRLRFDFHAPSSLGSEQLKDIENIINHWINNPTSLEIQEMPLEKAKQAGALAMFGEKYDDIVRVVDVPGISLELCGGTHVKNTSEIGLFKIVSESSVAAGIRRIEAIAGPALLNYLNERDDIVKQLSNKFKSLPSELISRVDSLQEELKKTTKALNKTRDELVSTKTMSLTTKAIEIGKSQVVVERLDGVEGGALLLGAENLTNKLGRNGAVFLGGLPNPKDQRKVILVASFGDEIITKGLNAGKFIGGIAKLCGGGGGGKANLAQAGGRDGSKLNDALNAARKSLESLLQ